MSENYTWSGLATALSKALMEALSQRLEMTPERTLAAFYLLRVEQRTRALSLLFEAGLYEPTIPIIRSAYEDWLSCAWISMPGHADHVDELHDSLGAEYARVYKRFMALCGKKAANQQFANHPDYALPYLEIRADPPHRSRNWREKAAVLGLGEVHDVAYNYLSELAHGSLHSLELHIGAADDRVFPQPVERDTIKEEPLALWAFWFHLRVIALAAAAWGRDYEGLTDHWLDELSRIRKMNTMSTCVMVRERLGASEHS